MDAEKHLHEMISTHALREEGDISSLPKRDPAI